MATTDSTPGTPHANSPTLPRVVPGAPPPVPPSKSQKKKRKSQLKTLAASAHEAALTDHAPDADDIKAGKVDPVLLANPAPGSSAPDTGDNTEAEDSKPAAEAEKSVVADAIHKRVKALGKKAQRFHEYKAMDKLNEDQKAAIAGLPVLEGTIKELESIRKTVETLEAGASRTRAQERAELHKQNERRVSEAAQHAEAALLPRITSLLSFLALRNLLTHSTPTDLSISEPEREAILSAGDALLAYPPVGHVEEIVQGFLSGAGSWQDIEYARLVEITSQFSAPRTPTPIPDPSIPLDPTASATLETEHIPEPEPEPEQEPEPEVEPEVEAVLGIPAPTTTGGGFHFMQESELDAPAEMTESQEWVAVQPTVNSEDIAVEVADEAEAAQADIGGEVPSTGVTTGAEVAEGVTGGGAPLDWAGEGDDELPDLGGLQATFGGSGTQTPIAQPPAAGAPAPSSGPVTDDDGFTSIPGRRGHGQRGSFGGERGYRGRGRGRGGFRGGEGGGYRGDRGEGGGYRGGEGGGYNRGGEGGEGGEGGGGGYRGRGGYRGYRGGGEGGEGGEGGGYRGRGGYRGGEGGYRGGEGGYRGGGEGGEGRGRGRGGWGQGEGDGRGGRGGYRGGERRGSGFRGRGGGAPGTGPPPETAA